MMSKSKRRNRRRNLKAKREELSISQFQFRELRNPLAPTEFLPEAQLNKLHEASMQILEEIGIDFFDAEALSLWEKAGAKVDHKARHVWIDRALLLGLVAKAPTEFTWLARNPKYNLSTVSYTHLTLPTKIV